MCANFLKRPFAMIEGSKFVGSKINVSGGGKCNFSNEVMNAEYFVGDETFINTILSRFDVEAMKEIMQAWKIDYSIRKNRQFFCKTPAKNLVNAMRHSLPKAPMLLGQSVLKVNFNKGKFFIRTTKESLSADKVVIATGGLSYPALGASGIGYEIAKNFGHTVFPLKPALVGFTVQPSEFWVKEISGVSTPVRVTLGERVFHDNILCTHKGLSGPAMLNASLYWDKGSMLIDFLPDYDWDKDSHSKKHLTTLLPLPKRFIMAYLRVNKMDDKPAFKLNKQEQEVIRKLYNYPFAPAGTFGFTRAEITKGGINTDEINPQTMESLKQEGLYFLGEVLDVNGQLGGYNIHFAFASAKVCADALNRG